MWSFTGHCAYSYDCNKWQVGCGQCPYLNTYPAIQRDVTRLEWQLKNWVYSQSYLTIVTPSRWLKEQAQASLLSRFPIYHIPHGIDTGTYQPIDPVLCRRALDIPDNKRVIMFASTHLKDFRKGGDLLLQSLQVLPDSLKKEILLVTLGASGETIKSEVGVPTLSLGYLKNDRLKSIAFSAADLFIFPTRADNLPLVLQESIACGTPVVSFEIGGVPDLVRPGITGYLAPAENIKAFAQSIVQLLEDNQLRQKMSTNCRQIAVEEYALELQAQRYIDVYKECLKYV